MTLKQKIEDDAKKALREHEGDLLSTLRMLLAAVRNREIEKRTKLSKRGGTENLEKESQLTDEEMVETIRTEAKKRKDAIEGYEKGGRQEAAEREKRELVMLQSYLPEEMSDEELEKIVGEVVGGLGEVTQKDFGRVMGEIMKRAKGQASGDRVSRVVKKVLG
ncbi:MAG: GatB/YqeY domain-containing protein [bacterium]|nr:GatB/YqeY domain-containing protein [bacterium]